MKPIHYQYSHIGDAVVNDDGYYVFFPIQNGGYWSADVLRHVADTLDELNRGWDAQVKRDMEAMN